MPPVPPLTPAAQNIVRSIQQHTDTLRIDCEDHIRGLVQFFAKHGTRYTRWTSSLYFTVGAIDGDVAAMLEDWIDTWGRLMPLQSLGFDNAEALLESHPPLAKAFAALSTIKTLHIRNVGRLAHDMLVEMKSSLLSAELSLSDDPLRLPRELRYSDPIRLLLASEATLRKLKAESATTNTPEGSLNKYPKMRELELNWVDVPSTYDYVAAFPNLKYLTISSVLPSRRGDLWTNCERYRRFNQDSQDSHGSWTSLARVKGSILDVYVLGLRCSVEALELVGTTASEDRHLSMLGAVIEETEPTNVKLTADSDHIIDDGLIYAFDDKKIRGFEFRKLEIIVTVDCNIPGHRVGDTVDYIAGAIHGLRIEELYLTFDVKATNDRSTGADAPERSYLARTNLKYFGGRIIGRVTRLKMVSVSVRGLRPGEPDAYEDAVLWAAGRARTFHTGYSDDEESDVEEEDQDEGEQSTDSESDGRLAEESSSDEETSSSEYSNAYVRAQSEEV
ncbi:hypothetical protein L226DRAFT_229395 [Lentinus tigrinus ALCF2SS1-7]|uniref:F-box domain-containing protein n=1 Tax=Lentinus tigrinus ALCF2SS1-6 TaxID=1328759 RepID=A0A5C2RWZ7_9APHY|nr:hypothetical protein L227DRAFT_657159 [Lentinus tigrinus ALCF2SS1-6]RPD70301.1 hypothetical protein L226DRAFT_229395 [Lentinus tigrinus ALCF2SS1-7]